MLICIDTLYKKSLMFLGRTELEKNAMITCKIHSCTIVLINNFENLQLIIAFFSNSVQPRNMKVFWILTCIDTLYKKKIHVPRLHSFQEKCNDNLQNSKLHNCNNKQL